MSFQTVLGKLVSDDRVVIPEDEGVVIENNVVAWVLGKAKVSDKAAVFDELMGQKQ
jgi:hypothetical protein